MSMRYVGSRKCKPRSWMCALAACLWVLLTCGCAKETPTPEPVTVSFAYPESEGEYYEKLLPAFGERYPQITVTLHPRRTAEYEDVAEVAKADTFVLYPQTQLASLLDQDALLELTWLIEQDDGFDPTAFYSNAIELCTLNGRMWAVPAQISLGVMFYNKDLFDRYGVPYPSADWTWDAFLDTALALRHADAEVYGYEADPLLAMLAVYQHGGRIADDLQNPARTTFDDPLTVEAIDWYVELVHEYGVAPTMGTFVSPQEGWLYGKVGMATYMLDQQGGAGWTSEWPMRWGVAPLPRDQQAATLALVAGYGISSQAADPEACWAWISYLSEQVPALVAPARRSLVESAAYEERAGKEVADTVRAALEDSLLLYPHQDQVLALFVRAVAEALSGQATAQEAMTRAQQQSPYQ